MKRRVLLLISFVIRSFLLVAQGNPYPQNYFRDPLNIPIKLAANFGELRPNHWHMGLDIRTDQKENLPVFASAEGYIAHIGIRPQSFGRFIIINHPNGYSTLYGHLNDFFPALEKYVTDKQYQKESWEMELDFTKDQFPVKKGEFIAFSGTTGGSQGPHVHFEIRDTKTNRCINPLFFGLDFKDDVRPTLVKLAMYDRNRSVYQQTAQFFLLKNTDSGYIIPKIPVIKTGLNKVSFSIQAYDRSTGSTNPNGIYSAKLFADDQPIVGFQLDSLDYNETEAVNAQIDYTYRYNGGPFLQHLSKLAGDNGNVYQSINGDGSIELNDSNVHLMRIEVKDAYLNTSQIIFSVQHFDSLSKPGSASLPNSLLAPNRDANFGNDSFSVLIPRTALYDSVHYFYFQKKSFADNSVSSIIQVNDPSIPVHGQLTMSIKPNKSIPTDWKNKLVMQRSGGNGVNVRKVELDEKTSGGPWVTGKFSDFGNFEVHADLDPPQLNELGRGDTVDLSPLSRIVFVPKDNFGVIRNFRAELDGKWLRFTNDKGAAWIYIFDDRCPDGIHQLKVSVEDIVGNRTEKSWWFKKYPYTPPKKTLKKKKGKTPVSSKKKPAAIKKKSLHKK